MYPRCLRYTEFNFSCPLRLRSRHITVADFDQAIARTLALGGKLLIEPKAISDTQRYAVIQDPAGAIAALLG